MVEGPGEAGQLGRDALSEKIWDLPQGQKRPAEGKGVGRGG